MPLNKETKSNQRYLVGYSPESTSLRSNNIIIIKKDFFLQLVQNIIKTIQFFSQ